MFIEMSLCVLQKLLVLSASLFDYVKTKRMIFKIMNRNSRHQVQAYEISA